MIDAEASDLTVECNGSSNSAQILSWLNSVGNTGAASDICGDITWTNDYGTISDGCGSTGAVTVTFTASDNCGNTATTTATLTIDDGTPPTWELDPQDLTIICNGTTDPLNAIDAWLETVGGGEAEDDCSLVTYLNDYTTLSNGCSGSTTTGSALVTFTATDACGNMITRTATVEVIDNVAPTIIVPAQDTIVECNGSGNSAELMAWLDENADAMASDDCSAITWSNMLVDSTLLCAGTYERTYAFIATDDCGNASVQTLATFAVSDTTAPVFDVLPTDMTVDCDGAGNTTMLQAWLASNGGTGEASDICGDVSWTTNFVQELDACGTTGTNIFEFTIHDNCGNTATATANFIIQDTMPPMMVCCPDFSIPLVDGLATITPDSLDCGSSDICTPVTQLTRSISQSTFDESHIGPNNVVLTVTDECGNSSTCEVIVTITENPVIGVAKRAVSVVNNQDGSGTVQYEINVENYGDVTLDSIQVLDTLFNTFDAPCNPTVVEITSDAFIINSDFNGITDFNLLAGVDDLDPGEKGSILLTVRAFDCGTNQGPFANSAHAEGTSPSGTKTTDISDDGANPDTDGDGTPNEDGENDPTLVQFENVYNLGVSKDLVQASVNADGTYNIIYEVRVENLSSVRVDDIQLTDNLAATFPGCTLDPSNVALTSGEFTVLNGTYDGFGMNLLLQGDDMLEAGEQGAVLIELTNLDCMGDLGPFLNNASVTGTSIDGIALMDLSVDGPDPDPNGDGVPTEQSPTPVDFNENDTLSNTFGPATDWEVIGIQSEEFVVNANYDGDADPNLVDPLAENILEPGDEGGIALTVRVEPGAFAGPYENQAMVLANSAFGTPITDLSDDGYETDADGDGMPDEDGENDPTLVSFDPCFVNIICPPLPDTITVENDNDWCQALINLPEAMVETCAGVADTIFEYKLEGVGADGQPLDTYVAGQPTNLEYFVGM